MESNGHQLVRRILVRRILKCIRSKKHQQGHCKLCGLDVSRVALPKNNTI